MPIFRVSFNHICSFNILKFGDGSSVIGDCRGNPGGNVGKKVVDDFDTSHTKIK